MNKFSRFSLLTLALAVLTVVGVYATTLTYSQGYTVGCGLGNAETYVNENLTIAMATYDDFTAMGEVHYALGAMEGYWACKYVAPVHNGRPGGTWCSVEEGCNNDDPLAP